MSSQMLKITMPDFDEKKFVELQWRIATELDHSGLSPIIRIAALACLIESEICGLPLFYDVKRKDEESRREAMGKILDECLKKFLSDDEERGGAE